MADFVEQGKEKRLEEEVEEERGEEKEEEGEDEEEEPVGRDEGRTISQIDADTMPPEMAPKMPPEMTPEMPLGKSPKMPPEMAPEMPLEQAPEMPPESVPDILPEMAPEMPPETSPEMPPETAPEMPLENAPDMPTEMAPEMPLEKAPEMPPEIAPDIPPEMPLEMTPEMPPEIAPDMPPEKAPEMPPKIAADMPPEMAPETAPEKASEMPPEMAPSGLAGVVALAVLTSSATSTAGSAGPASTGRDPSDIDLVDIAVGDFNMWEGNVFGDEDQIEDKVVISDAPLGSIYGEDGGGSGRLGCDEEIANSSSTTFLPSLAGVEDGQSSDEEPATREVEIEFDKALLFRDQVVVAFHPLSIAHLPALSVALVWYPDGLRRYALVEDGSSDGCLEESLASLVEGKVPLFLADDGPLAEALERWMRRGARGVTAWCRLDSNSLWDRPYWPAFQGLSPWSPDGVVESTRRRVLMLADSVVTDSVVTDSVLADSVVTDSVVTIAELRDALNSVVLNSDKTHVQECDEGAADALRGYNKDTIDQIASLQIK